MASGLRSKLKAAAAGFTAGAMTLLPTVSFSKSAKSDEATGIQASLDTSSIPSVERKIAYRASTDQVVLHYGEGIPDVAMIAFENVAEEKNYPVDVFAGGEPGMVEMFIHRKPVGKYTRGQLADGTVAGHMQYFYEKVVGSRPDLRTASL